MAGIKIADVAKKLGSNEEETKQKITNGGFKIADDNTVGDEAVKALGIDPQHLRLDRRQEMLKKAMERHKRHPRSREVKVGSGDEPSAPKKISKQELMDRKKKLENTIRKVDEHRETMKDEQMNDTPSPAVEKSSAPEKTETVKQETVKTAAQQSETAESSAKTETKETVTPQTQTEQKQEVRPKPQQPAGERRPQGDRDNRPQGDRPAYNRDNRPQGDRPPYNRDNRQQGDRPPYNRDNRTQGDRPPYNRDNRPQGDRPPYNRDNRTQGDRPPYNRDNRTQGDRPPYNRDNRTQGDRPPYNRDNHTQGDRPPYRPQGDRPSRPKPGLDEGGALAPEKKKVLKDKPKAAPVEAKKVKSSGTKERKKYPQGYG